MIRREGLISDCRRLTKILLKDLQSVTFCFKFIFTIAFKENRNKLKDNYSSNNKENKEKNIQNKKKSEVWLFMNYKKQQIEKFEFEKKREKLIQQQRKKENIENLQCNIANRLKKIQKSFKKNKNNNFEHNNENNDSQFRMRKVKTEEDKINYENINSDYSGLYEEFKQIMIESLKTETPKNCNFTNRDKVNCVVNSNNLANHKNAIKNIKKSENVRKL